MIAYADQVTRMNNVYGVCDDLLVDQVTRMNIINKLKIYIIIFYMDQEIIIRKAKCTDIKDLININKISLPVVYNKEEWIELIIYHTVFVAHPTMSLHTSETSEKTLQTSKTAKAPVSYIVSWEETTDVSPYKKGHIVTFATLPDWRSKQIGSKLLQYTLQHWYPLPVTLNVEQKNKRAIKLYRKNKFHKLKKLKNYYSKGEHGIQLIHNNKEE